MYLSILCFELTAFHVKIKYERKEGEKMKTAEKIKNLRLKRHLTQKQLAKLAGVSEITIRKYEAGERTPKKEQLQQLANSLDVNINALLDDDMLKTEYKTVADIMTLLFTLDEVVGLSFDGERGNDGRLIPETISIRLNNDRVNEVVSTWESTRQDYLDDFAKALSAIQKGKEMGVEGLMDIMNLDPEGTRLHELEMSIIAGAEIPLQGEFEE